MKTMNGKPLSLVSDIGPCVPVIGRFEFTPGFNQFWIKRGQKPGWQRNPFRKRKVAK